MNDGNRWQRWLAAWATAALLAACGGGSSDTPPIAARAGAAEIGAAGGNVDAVLEGGAGVRLDVPPGALAQTVTLRIDPVAPQGQAVGAFEIRPTGIALARPATLTVTSNGHLANDTVLMQRAGALTTQLSRSLGATGQVQVLLTSLGAPPRMAASQAAGRARALVGADGSDPMTLELQRLAAEAQVAALNGAIDFTVGGNGSLDNAVSTEIAFEAVVSSLGAAQPGLRDAALRWREFVCGQRAFSVSALNAFAGTDAPTFRLRVRDALAWGQIAQTFAGVAATLSPPVAPCDGAPADFRQPVRDRLPGFIDAARRALDLLDVGYLSQSADFDQLLGARVPELIRIEALLREFDAGVSLDTLIEAQARRLRRAAFAQCEFFASQARQTILLTTILADPLFGATAGYDAAAVRTDIHYCGAHLFARKVDANGQVLESTTNERLRVQTEAFIDPPLIRRHLDMRGVPTLRLDAGVGQIRALICPAGLSRNNEQLVIEAGASAQNLTEVGRLTPSNAEAYLAGGLDVRLDATALAALRNTATDETLLRVRRSGETCFGGFPGLSAHPVLLELVLRFGAAPTGRLTHESGASLSTFVPDGQAFCPTEQLFSPAGASSWSESLSCTVGAGSSSATLSFSESVANGQLVRADASGSVSSSDGSRSGGGAEYGLWLTVSLQPVQVTLRAQLTTTGRCFSNVRMTSPDFPSVALPSVDAPGSVDQTLFLEPGRYFVTVRAGCGSTPAGSPHSASFQLAVTVGPQ